MQMCQMQGTAHTHAKGQGRLLGLRNGPTACGCCLPHHTHTKKTAETNTQAWGNSLEGRFYPNELKNLPVHRLVNEDREYEVLGAITSG